MGGGLNKKAAASDIADGQLQEALGCRYDITGAVSSENGRELLDTFADGEIRGSFDSYRDGTKRRILKAGTAVHQDDTEIGTFAGTGQLSGITFDGLDYLCDGANTASYDGTTLRSGIGIAGPTTAPTLTSVGAGAILTDGTYTVAYSWVIKRSDDSTACESNLSPIDRDAANKGFISTTSATSITVGGFAAAPAGATHIRIYRSIVDKKPLFFDGEITVATSTYSITTKVATSKGDSATVESALEAEDVIDDVRPVLTFSDYRRGKHIASTSVTALNTEVDKKSRQGPNQSAGGPQYVQTNLGMLADWVDHNPAPTDLRHLVHHGRQLFGISGKDVVFCRVGEPEHWPIFNAFQPGRNTGEVTQALLPLNGEIIVYTDTSIYRAMSLDLSFEDARLVDVDSPVGLAAEWGVTSITIGGRQAHIFIATSGLYLFDGQSAHEIGFNIEHLFDGSSDDSISLGNVGLCRAVSKRDKVWISYPTGSANDRTLFLDFQNPEEPKFAILPYGYTTIDIEKKDGLIFGGDAAGNTYEVDTGSSNGDEEIDWGPRSKEYVLGLPNTLITLESVVLDADFGGLATDITVSMDSGRSYTTSVSAGPGRDRPVVEVPTYMKGNRVDVKLESTGIVNRHWYGVGFNFRPGGPPTP